MSSQYVFFNDPISTFACVPVTFPLWPHLWETNHTSSFLTVTDSWCFLQTFTLTLFFIVCVYVKYVWAQVLYLFNFKVKPKSETKCAVLSSFKLPAKL